MSEIEPNKKWQIATVKSVHQESARVKLISLDLAEQTPIRAGQYFDIRLTAPDGYQAQRSYSAISSNKETNSLELAIELITDGEVSSYLHEMVIPGDQIELRGPIGGHFTLSPNYSKPVLLVAGGSGIAPIMSMIRSRADAESSYPLSLLFSVRTENDILFKTELEKVADETNNFELFITLTRSISECPSMKYITHGRIDRKMIGTVITSLIESSKTLNKNDSVSLPARAYVCGGSGFVEAIGSYLLDLGMGYDDIRTERFGP